MQLNNCELLPGVIADTNDPLKMGRIKCIIPGYVDPSFSNENMPWVRPLGMYNHQSFSKMMPGYKVWILVNKINYNEYWYFPFFELNDIAKNFLESTYDKEQPEIFMAHNCGGNNALFTYDETNGYQLSVGQHHIELHPDGKISIVGGDAHIEIDGSKIKIGAGESDQPAVLGNELKAILEDLKSAMDDLASKCAGDASPLKSGFIKASNAFNPLGGMLSENISVD